MPRAKRHVVGLEWHGMVRWLRGAGGVQSARPTSVSTAFATATVTSAIASAAAAATVTASFAAAALSILP
jgi:hypothetical protein